MREAEHWLWTTDRKVDFYEQQMGGSGAEKLE